jgi:hypothetical protein
MRVVVRISKSRMTAFAASGEKFRACEQAAGHGAPHIPPFCEVLHGSGEPLEDARHLLLVVGSERGGPHVAQRADLQKVGAHGFVVWCLEDGDHVIGSDSPIGLLQLHPMLLGDLAAVVGPLGGLLDVPYALVGPVEQDHVGRHTISSSFFL